MSLARKIWETLSEPRFVTGLALTVYLVTGMLGVDLLTQPREDPITHWVPSVLLIVGSIWAFACAWPLQLINRVGACWGKNLEKVGLILLAGGLITGTLAEINDLLASQDAAGDYTVALLIICVLLAVARWIQLTIESHKHYQRLMDVTRRAR